MLPGKAAAQALHAACLSLLRRVSADPSAADAFLRDGCCGAAVVVVAPGLPELEEARARADAAGLPAALFWDSGHVPRRRPAGGGPAEPNPNFTGDPVPTALAVGHAPRSAVRPLARGFPCA